MAHKKVVPVAAAEVHQKVLARVVRQLRRCSKLAGIRQLLVVAFEMWQQLVLCLKSSLQQQAPFWWLAGFCFVPRQPLGIAQVTVLDISMQLRVGRVQPQCQHTRDTSCIRLQVSNHLSCSTHHLGS